MRLKLISCDIFEREVKAAAARSNNHIEFEFLSKAPHQLSDCDKVESVQAAINRAPRTKFHAVLLLTGSCKDGLGGLRARSIPLVLPRARDCISLVLQRPAPKPHRPLEQVHKATVGSVRSRRVSGRGQTWSPPAPPKLEGARMPALPGQTWTWRQQFGPSVARSSGRQTCSVLELLVNGYWNYTDFLVVAPRWRVVINDEGTLAAEECTS